LKLLQIKSTIGIIKSFKSHYANQLVNFFVEQTDNEYISKLIMPDVKKCMYMIKHAWKQVSCETIKNCWSKCDILDTTVNDQIKSLMNIDCSDIVIKMLNLS
jgi:hypothetical protein